MFEGLKIKKKTKPASDFSEQELRDMVFQKQKFTRNIPKACIEA